MIIHITILCREKGNKKQHTGHHDEKDQIETVDENF